MLRDTAEQAMTQTGFVFDETTGMYYDHSTGFYYDSATQLYYDNNTGIYYCYDADSGRYQFHSKIEVMPPAAQTEPPRLTGIKMEENEYDVWVERRAAKRSAGASRRSRQRSSSPDSSPERRKDSSRSRQERRKPPTARKKRKSGSHSTDEGSGTKKKKAKKSKSEKHKKKSKKEKKKKKKSKKTSSKSRRSRSSSDSEDSDGDSEPEEGELTESEGERRSSPSPSSTSSSSSPVEGGAESDMEAAVQEVADIWPPCVRVTVVRSPVLQVGTLFIITADSPGTIGREKDMDHAIRIAEMGVSKVYFDQEQQCYMLQDQGSQNGTVLNGNRIPADKVRAVPAGPHGDEVKMGETVLSFHIHSGTRHV
ncbi:hypothetical protein CRUP_019992 [Coryphaenoides rupestris]|nr:hypothetical protein CRUP_019992 [Coryphaenoides rupestris]